MSTTKTLLIAVDFDNTLVMGGTFPAIGVPVPKAFPTLKHLQQLGCTLILWTCRTGEALQEAVDYCAKMGITFASINEDPTPFDGPKSCKVFADWVIDDRNLGIHLKKHTLPSGEVCEAVDWDFVLSALLFLPPVDGRSTVVLDDAYTFIPDTSCFI